eukprot:scaffold102224_cov72-Phaeocystis_antarctica.AAC.2
MAFTFATLSPALASFRDQMSESYGASDVTHNRYLGTPTRPAASRPLPSSSPRSSTSYKHSHVNLERLARLRANVRVAAAWVR